MGAAAVISVLLATSTGPASLAAAYILPYLIAAPTASRVDWRWSLGLAAAATASLLARSWTADAPFAGFDLTLCVLILAIGAALLARSSAGLSEQTHHESSDELSRRLADITPAFLWTVSSDGKVRLLNRQLECWTGLAADDLLALPDWIPLFHPEDHSALERFRDSSSNGETVHLRARLRRSDGNHAWLALSKMPSAPSPSSNLIWVCSAFDIDNEVRAVEEVGRLNATLITAADEARDSAKLYEARFRTLFNDLNIACTETAIDAAKALIERERIDADFEAFCQAKPDVVAECHRLIRCTAFSEAFMTLIGERDEAHLVALPLDTRVVEAARLKTLQLQCLYDGKRHFETTVNLIASDGTKIPVALGANMPDDWSTAYYTHVNISEQQRAHELALLAREELGRANRVATMGALSASLAHELNQPLSAMQIDARTTVRLLENDPPSTGGAIDAVYRLIRTLDRIGEIVRRTRERLVRGRSTPSRFNLCQLAEEVSDLLEADLAKRRVSLAVACEDEALEIEASRVEMQQVFINLVMNAADAMGGISKTGPITLRIFPIGSDEIGIDVEDTGPGIPPDKIDHVFDAFFTTKEGGIGLGLQICRSIIESVGGVLTASNRAEGGAAFQIRVPRARN